MTVEQADAGFARLQEQLARRLGFQFRDAADFF